MKVSVIGAPGCGRTVFLGLLYETLIRMSTTEGDDRPEAIVNAGPVEAQGFGDLRLQFLSGRWPSPEMASRVSGSSLDLGFPVKRSIPFLRSYGIRTVKLNDVPLSEKDVKVIRAAGQLRDVLLGTPGGSIDRYGLSERFRDSLESDAIILLADVSQTQQERSWSREENDAFLATIAESASHTRLGRPREMTFIIVLTKAERAEADDQKVFEEAYPRTSEVLRGSATGKGAASHILVSWLVTMPDQHGKQVPATTVQEGQVRIEYSEREYRRLVGIIGKIA